MIKHTGNKAVLTQPLRARAGFTFIEILFVIIILGILIGVSFPKFRKAFNSLQLSSFSQEFQSFIGYLRQRSIVEEKIIYLNIDNGKKEYWAQVDGADAPFKLSSVPAEISVAVAKPGQSDSGQILFYPDGRIEPVNITFTNNDNQKVWLTTKGAFGGVKVSSPE